jgi:hypothetical protein
MKRNDSFGDRRLRAISDKIRDEKHIEEYHNKKKKRKETTHKQQILILHYLGILDQLKNTTVNKGLLFSDLLNMDKKNTEDYIRYVGGKIEENEIKTRNNLEFVYKLFDELEMTELAGQVKRDIDKLK